MPPIHAGGLPLPRHGADPSVLYTEAHRRGGRPRIAAQAFARAEGIIPAPESAHAIRAAIDEALDAKAKGEERTIVFGLSGHGYLDLASYDAFLAGRLENYAYPEERVRAALGKLPQPQQA